MGRILWGGGCDRRKGDPEEGTGETPRRRRRRRRREEGREWEWE
jgi:hypothetical protein